MSAIGGRVVSSAFAFAGADLLGFAGSGRMSRWIQRLPIKQMRINIKVCLLKGGNNKPTAAELRNENKPLLHTFLDVRGTSINREE